MHNRDTASSPQSATVRRSPVKVARQPRSDDGDAFIVDPQGGPAKTRDDLAETLAEEFLSSATSGEEVGEDVRDEFVDEELGGPFVTASAEDEFADTTDDLNPEDAEREPFPRAVGGKG